MDYRHLLGIIICLLASSEAFGAEYEDSQLFPFDSAMTAKPEVQQEGWLPKIELKNPIKPVTRTLGSSWNSVKRTTGKAWHGTREALTPSERFVPDLKMPHIPKPNLHWPSWGSSPAKPAAAAEPETVGDWLSLPHALPE